MSVTGRPNYDLRVTRPSRNSETAPYRMQNTEEEIRVERPNFVHRDLTSENAAKRAIRKLLKVVYIGLLQRD